MQRAVVTPRTSSSSSEARIEHSRLHGVARDLDDLGNLADRPLVVVDKVDDLAVRGRQIFQAIE